MRRTILAVVFAFSPVPALAQQPESAIPRVEVGLGTGGAVYPHGGSVGVGQVRVGVGISARFGVEAAMGVGDWQFDGNPLRLVYTFQGRYALNPHPGRLAASVSFGGSGRYTRYRTPPRTHRLPNGDEIVAPAFTSADGLPPIAPTVGVTVHYAVTRRIAVRADAQTVFCYRFDAVGALVSAGVAIPIPSRRSR